MKKLLWLLLALVALFGLAKMVFAKLVIGG
jgi:hypothetical protein